MDPFSLRKLGRSEVELPALGMGGAPLGELFTLVSEEQTEATMREAWEGGVRYYDTAPWYGIGLSEHRLGQHLYRWPREEFVLSTKVGRILRAPKGDGRGPKIGSPAAGGAIWTGGLPFEVVFDYSYDGVMRSFEDSLQRLRLTRIDVLVIHDLDSQYHAPGERLDAGFAQLIEGGFKALADLRAEGLVGAIGAGVNALGTIPRFFSLFDLDFFLVALPYTLGEQGTLDEEFPLCAERGIGFVIGGVFNSGLYATGPAPGARYNYREPTPQELDKAGRIKAVCDRHGVPLAAAALQFPLHHPLVASVIPGAFSPEHVRMNIAAIRHEIPNELWAELKHEGLIRADAPTP